jgi:hypothetical protein
MARIKHVSRKQKAGLKAPARKNSANDRPKEKQRTYTWTNKLADIVDKASDGCVIRVLAPRQAGITRFAETYLVKDRNFAYITPNRHGRKHETLADRRATVSGVLRGEKGGLAVDLMEFVEPDVKNDVEQLRGKCRLVLFDSREDAPNITVETTTTTTHVLECFAPARADSGEDSEGDD